tara:strand:- start:6515 stop:7546 length:1032 start_codon:yes stop_codon:yes gene_type:complete
MNLLLTKEYNFKNKTIEIKNSESQTLSIKTVNAILETLKLDRIKSKNEYFKNIYDSLNRQNVDWTNFLPQIQKTNYSLYLKKEIALSEKYVTNYFYEVFPKRLTLFRNIHVLNSADTYPVYKHSNVTGRLSMEKGVNYLTMKKNDKKLLRSPFKDHSLFELDFKSCEPNLYARFFNLVPEDTIDIYLYLANEIGINIDDRSKLKRIVLSLLYGANERAISKISKINIKKVKEVKRILNVDNFERMLKKEFNEKGFIENMYGRPILSDTNLVNYWIQSSAVDFCCLSFLKLFSSNPEFKLHAVIHDAIIFSIPDKDINNLKSIKSLGDNNLFIPVEINEIKANN